MPEISKLAPPVPVPPALPALPAIVSSAALTFGAVLARMNTGLTICTGLSAVPLALPFCAPFLLGNETVVAVDGANCFNLYRLTEWARRKRIDPLALLQRLRIARAFTPFQLATILHHIGKEMARHRATRLVITGFPDCLYDEELSEQEARNTFARCQESLLHLTGHYTVLIVSDTPAHPVGGRIQFFNSLAPHAHSAFAVNHTEPVSFSPLQSPGLLTVPQGESQNGQDSSNRQSGARTKPRPVGAFLPGLAP